MRAVNICCSAHHQQYRKKLKMDYSIFFHEESIVYVPSDAQVSTRPYSVSLVFPLLGKAVPCAHAGNALQ